MIATDKHGQTQTMWVRSFLPRNPQPATRNKLGRPFLRSAGILLLILTAVCGLYGQEKDHTQWWLYNYGDYAKTDGRNDIRVKHAYRVFERVKNAADKAEARMPRLFIINTTREPYAVALPDGGIIIGVKTLDICYARTLLKEGDRRLAFILGHELAHLANKDFLHREAFLALEKHGDKKARKELLKYFKLSEPAKAREFKQRELLADKKGALYASMAGYDVGELFLEKNNFLTHWAAQTGVGMFYDEKPKHPSFAKRLRFIRPQLQAVARKLELFKAGVLLFQMENFLDASAAFREFSQVYPAREVLNNIGACHLNSALRRLQLWFGEDYYRFRLSTAIDYTTTAVVMQSRAGWDYLRDKEIARNIARSVDYFQRAAARDLHHRPSRYNLAAALILKKEYARAQAECDSLLKIDSRDVNALNNKAVAFYYYGKEEGVETTRKAVQLLQKACHLEPGNFEALYNLASIKQERKRPAGAKLYWEKYLNLKTTPKDNFYNYVYKKLKGTTPPKPAVIAQIPQIPGGIRVGESISLIEKKWGKQYKRKYRLGSEENEDNDEWYIPLHVFVKDSFRVVALDDTVEIVEVECSPVEDTADVLKKYGPPRKIVHFAGGNFYVYDGFSFKEIGGKVHSRTWFEKEL
jgi:tetratricopeptide (TPR) repeat protein